MKGAFIDRDGVIIEERGYAYRIEDFAPLPGAIARAARSSVRRLPTGGDHQSVRDCTRAVQRADYLSVQRAHAGATAGRGGATGRGGILPASCPMRRWRATASIATAASPGRRCCNGRPRGSASIWPARCWSVIGARDIEAGRAAGVGRCFLVRSGQAPRAAGRIARRWRLRGSGRLRARRCSRRRASR